MARWCVSFLLATGGLGCGATTDGQQCTAQDQAACQRAYAAIQALHAEVASCKPADVCVPVNTGLQGGPKCSGTFSCPFAVRGDVDLGALSIRVAAISASACDVCETMCPPVPCVLPAPTARCNAGTGLCQLAW